MNFAWIEPARARWNVLEHSFYRRWSAGELSRRELAVYAGEYRHAVQALADGLARTAHGADPSIAEHALRVLLFHHAPPFVSTHAATSACTDRQSVR